MKHSYIIHYIAALIATLLPPPASAQKNEAGKALCTVYTYRADGTLIGSSRGFFLSDSGDALASYSLFEGATRAEIVDAKGTHSAVLRLQGANATLDLVRFTTEARKTAFLPTASAPATEGTQLWILTSAQKNAEPVAATVSTVEDWQGYAYYSIGGAPEPAHVGCPLIDAEGRAVAIVQKSYGTNAETSSAVDARAAAALLPSAVSFLSSDLKALSMPRALPADEQDALSALFLLGYADSLVAATAMEDFITEHPKNSEIYIERASFRAAWGNFSDAEADFATALRLASQPAEVHYRWARVMMQYASQAAAQGWTAQKAAEEAAEAWRLTPAPLYRYLEGEALFAAGDYAEAATALTDVNQSALAEANSFYLEALARLRAENDSARVLALFDSAVARTSSPLRTEEARYVAARGRFRQSLGMYREAVSDYNLYEDAVEAARLTGQFYSVRSDAELKAKMYQQALDDIRTAQRIEGRQPLLCVKEAVILLEAGEWQPAVDAAQKALELLPENPDCYKILGIAFGELGERKKAVEHLEKAIALGDTSAEPYLATYRDK